MDLRHWSHTMRGPSVGYGIGIGRLASELLSGIVK
jgi:hypothetical protein